MKCFRENISESFVTKIDQFLCLGSKESVIVITNLYVIDMIYESWTGEIS